MLSRLLIVRLKAAENALKDGRYDEAFRLATEPDIREHRRGGAVLRELTDCLLERARAHFKADRYAEALLDLTKAEAGGVRKEEIAELREQVRIVAEEELRKQNSRRLRLEAARRRIERGSLRGGERLLEEVSAADPDAQELQRHVEVRQQDAADALAEVERLIKQGELRRAAERLDRARSADPNAAQVAELEARISQEVVQRARASLEARRLQRAVDELNSLGTVGATRPERRELEQIIEQARRTGRALAENRFDDALQDVMRLQHLAPKLDWARQACNELKRLDELLLSLRAGPLGQCAEVGSVRVVVDGKTQGPDRPGVLDETVAVPHPPEGRGTLPPSMLLLVDGGGSFLLHRGDRISVGRAAASQPADVPIFSDLSERHAEIARVEDDYFLFASRDVEVGGRKTRHQLLRDGDRVVLGKRAKFTFRLPNRKSSSAVLEMSDSTRLPNDVRRVVLLRQTAMLGFGRGVHVSCSAADRELVLFERAGHLWVRPQAAGAVQTEAKLITVGRPTELCGVSFVIEPWQVRAVGQRTV
ncbi:MAG: FHA domain-containing protein [Planctomycetota bacterium]|jgi:hypothetical protein